MTTPPAATVEAEYIPDGRGLFCALCGRSAIRHITWRGKRLYDLPAPPAPDTIGSNFGNGGTFDPEAKAGQPLKDAVRIYRESQKPEAVDAPPKASSQD